MTIPYSRMARRQGSKARRRGEPLDACPYDRTDPLSGFWCQGWHGADEDSRNKERGRARREIHMPQCPYCGEQAELMMSSAPLYGGRDFGPVYICQPCQAWVGCHRGTHQPLGRLANAELRRAKREAHDAFDPLWKRKIEHDGWPQKQARMAAYLWLAEQLGIPPDDCHIGMFDVETCRRVVQICQERRKAA